jgi:alanine or glycine:cation symporter, AGCS family
MEQINTIISAFANLVWGTPLVLLLTGSGIFFFIYSKGVPIQYLGRALKILAGKYNLQNSKGDISQWQAVSTALASTIGMGNISGVAVAISLGGPGAVFWMWISAIIGMNTKFFTCTLSVMYRSILPSGRIVGGPMYFIVNGLGTKWKPMAVFFALSGMIGLAPFFQTNQLTRIIGFAIIPDLQVDKFHWIYLVLGILIMILVIVVLLGGIKRIANVASNLVPAMVVLYFVVVLFILIKFSDQVLPAFVLIFNEAFSAQSVLGGTVGALILIGVRRAAFSNEAGIGTSPMAHGEAKNNEPVHEGMAAMVEPLIDTIIVCTLTALAIIVTGVWQSSDADGIRLTAEAFQLAIPGNWGVILLTICVSIFSITSLFTFPYYGGKCVVFLFGEKWRRLYEWIYCLSIVIGSVLTLGAVIGIADIFYGLMALPNLIAALLLAPRVVKELKAYRQRVNV